MDSKCCPLPMDKVEVDRKIKELEWKNSILTSKMREIICSVNQLLKESGNEEGLLDDLVINSFTYDNEEEVLVIGQEKLS